MPRDVLCLLCVQDFTRYAECGGQDSHAHAKVIGVLLARLGDAREAAPDNHQFAGTNQFVRT